MCSWQPGARDRRPGELCEHPCSSLQAAPCPWPAPLRGGNTAGGRGESILPPPQRQGSPQPSSGDPSNHRGSDKSGPGRCETRSRSISPSLTPSLRWSHTPPMILYMEGEQGLRLLLLQPRAVEGEVADLLSLSVEQKGPRGRWGHVGPGRGPDAGRRDAGETWCHNGGDGDDDRERDGSGSISPSALHPSKSGVQHQEPVLC